MVFSKVERQPKTQFKFIVIVLFQLGLAYLLGMRHYGLTPKADIYDLYCNMTTAEVRVFSKYLAEIPVGYRDALSHFLHGE